MKHIHFIWQAFIVLSMMSASWLHTETPDECMRGRPYPVFSKNRSEISTHHFSLKSEHEANERVQLKAGALIQIHHWGCEYYAITFKIESPDILKSSTSKEAAFRDAIAQLRNLKQLNADSIFDLSLAANTLEKAITNPSSVEFDQEFPVAGDGTDFLQTQVKVDKAERHAQNGSIEITLFKGPL